MDKPLVSIIMPSYNSEKYIAASINSVLKQTYENWELIITDDCSTDSTVEIVSNFQLKDSRIKLFQNNKNSGAGESRNNSIDKASGRFIAFLDADDLWDPIKLEKQIGFMLNNDVAFSYTGYQKISDSGLGNIVMPGKSTTRRKLLHSNVIGCLTAVYDTRKLGKRYMPKIRKRQDMLLWLNILEDIPNAHCIQESLAFYRDDSGMTKNKLDIAKWQWRVYRSELKLGFSKSLYYFICYFFLGLLKYVK